jgi:hypothetical protein
MKTRTNLSLLRVVIKSAVWTTTRISLRASMQQHPHGHQDFPTMKCCDTSIQGFPQLTHVLPENEDAVRILGTELVRILLSDGMII